MNELINLFTAKTHLSLVHRNSTIDLDQDRVAKPSQ